MGIGAAWNEEESSAYGIPFPSTGARFLMLEEALQIIRGMWNKKLETTTFDHCWKPYLIIVKRSEEIMIPF